MFGIECQECKGTYVQPYPWLISVYKDEERMLVIPYIMHRGGFTVMSSAYFICDELDPCLIGSKIFDSMDVIRNSPISEDNAKEREKNLAWKKASKYKSWKSFWKNHLCTRVKVFESGQYEIYSLRNSEDNRCVYTEIVEKIKLGANARDCDIGESIIQVFSSLENQIGISRGIQ